MKNKKLLKSIIIQAIACIIIIFSDNIVTLIIIKSINKDFIKTTHGHIITCLLIFALAYSISKLLSIIIKKYGSLITEYAKSKYSILIYVMVILTLGVFYININWNTSDDAVYLAQINGILFLTYELLMLIIVGILIFILKKDQTLKIKEMQMNNLKEYTDNLEHLYMDMRKGRHDYINIISSMAGFIESKDIEGLEKHFNEHIYPLNKKMNRNKRMLQRNFYILVSYTTSEITSVEKFNKTELIDMCSTELTTRCQAILGALASCSVSGNVLDSNELAQLLYNAYNRDDASVMNIKDSIESGFFRLYTVSEDAFYKKQKEMESYLNSKARLKALEAIKKAIVDNDYKTPAREVLEEEEETSKRATNLINREDYEPEIKRKVNKIILDDFRETKKALLEQDAEQKPIFLDGAK